VVVNNIGTEQKTTVYDGRGNSSEIMLKPYESRWSTI